jgi:Primase C terminal 2 (PriCT-2)
LAPLYLPPTASIFGRASKAKSHWLYISPDATKETFADPISENRKNTLLELRADGATGGGHQTLMPPSVADGEQRRWDCNDDPAPVAARILRHRCALLAMACLVRRYISVYASERPDGEHLRLLWDFDPQLARPAFGWLNRPTPDQPQRYPRSRTEQAPEDLDLAEVVAAIPNRFDWEGWNNIGLAIFMASKDRDDGFITFDDFSSRNSKYDPGETEARWRHYGRCPPNRTGIGKLARLAYEAGWRPARRSAP